MDNYEKMRKKYKNSTKYKCPFCNDRLYRVDLVEHIAKAHKELIPENFTAAQVAYNHINNKKCGQCMVCHKNTEWDENKWKYDSICNNPRCRETLRENALKNHIRVYNTPTLLNDPEHQEKMLANRSISGKYKFKDGGVHTYTGSYEKNALEFMDKVMNIKSKELMCPGPVLEYNYKGEMHKWITDIFYIPANLVIEVKDGGSNPNNRQMDSYREKQIYKEKMITSAGDYNYLRLTDNSFDQLFEILALLKDGSLNDDESKISRIHESFMQENSTSFYVIPYMMNNAFATEGIGLMNDLDGEYITTIEDDKLTNFKSEEFLNSKLFSIFKSTKNISEYVYNTNSVEESVKSIIENITLDQLYKSDKFEEVNLDSYSIKSESNFIFNESEFLLPLNKEEAIELFKKGKYNTI